MQELPEFAYIYGLYDPRQPEIMMYIGKTNNPYSRLHYHRKDAKYHASNPTPVWKWILGIQAEGIEPHFRVLEECIFSRWKEREIAFIALWREKNSKLLNRLAGGNGSDVRSKKLYCDKCGTERTKTLRDTSLRCPICRPVQYKIAMSRRWERVRVEECAAQRLRYKKDDDYRATVKRNNAEYKNAKRAKGLCPEGACRNTPVPGKSLCRLHLKSAADRAQKKREAKTAQGLCSQSGCLEPLYIGGRCVGHRNEHLSTERNRSKVFAPHMSRQK